MLLHPIQNGTGLVQCKQLYGAYFCSNSKNKSVVNFEFNLFFGNCIVFAVFCCIRPFVFFLVGSILSSRLLRDRSHSFSTQILNCYVVYCRCFHSHATKSYTHNASSVLFIYLSLIVSATRTTFHFLPIKQQCFSYSSCWLCVSLCTDALLSTLFVYILFVFLFMLLFLVFFFLLYLFRSLSVCFSRNACILSVVAVAVCYCTCFVCFYFLYVFSREHD